jgi:hypothetical protein
MTGARMMPSKWKSRRWVEISDGSILPRASLRRND